MAKKSKKLLIALITIALCLCVIVGGTYALFTDKIILKNHLQAGTLNITLERTSLTSYILDDTTGYLTEITDDSTVDFTNPTSENIFGLKEDTEDTKGTRIVPLCFFEATMKVSNKSDVAFSYSLEIVLDGDSNDLANQLELSVTVNGNTTTKMLSEGLSVENVATLAINATSEFTVKILFKDLENTENNKAQDKIIDFDLVVSAVQVTQAPVVQG